MVARIGGALEQVVTAYRNGAGVLYPMYGEAFRTWARPASTVRHFSSTSSSDGFPRRPTCTLDCCRRRCVSLTSDVARGWSTIAMARAFPKAQVIGFDADESSIADAKANAATQRVAVEFETRDAETIPEVGLFDLILVLEALYDMARSVRGVAVVAPRACPRWEWSSSPTRRLASDSTRPAMRSNV